MADVASLVSPVSNGGPSLDQSPTDFQMPPFDPAIHLAFEPPTARHSFTELGLPKPETTPDMCFTEPFQLFSEEGIRMIRRDLLRKEVLDKHLRSWDRAPAYIGSHEETARWINSMWNHPATTECISKAFGLPVKILGRRGEVGYVNVQLGPEGAAGVYKLTEMPSKPLHDTIAASESQYDKVLTDSWHRDSTQIVCVVMLSDTSTMTGGETAIRAPDGQILKARGAKMGGAVVMQGCHTPHAALRAINAPERLSMVTSYSFADPNLDDSGTSLRSIDSKTHDVSLIQDHFLLHKLSKMRERIDEAMDRIKARQGSGEMPKREEVEPWVEEQITFLKHTSWELFERNPKYLYKDVPEDTLRNYLPNV
ncbi:hypothetical protein BP6252_05675 [Coleophoma cylindrospora]|uniref:Uncharacterized protein n=1 Tax=Coleophoma cylindrospora TaxID=1849047 RepID=A0A3D8RU49_9HELO|nr:hypothetical protein BP6252_05675 [Coleophoma cylindrospora]